MLSQLTTDEQALRLFFTDEIYLVNEPESALVAEIPQQSHIAVVPLVQEAEVVISAGNLQFKFLGNNKRNILILVNDAQNDVSDENGRELLRKIVKSVNLTANDFALLNYSSYSTVTFDQLKQYFSPVVVFSFGVIAAQLGLGSRPENTIVNEGSVRLIFSGELKDLDKDQNAKKVLWGSLKLLEL